MENVLNEIIRIRKIMITEDTGGPGVSGVIKKIASAFDQNTIDELAAAYRAEQERPGTNLSKEVVNSKVAQFKANLTSKLNAIQDLSQKINSTNLDSTERIALAEFETLLKSIPETKINEIYQKRINSAFSDKNGLLYKNYESFRNEWLRYCEEHTELSTYLMYDGFNSFINSKFGGDIWTDYRDWARKTFLNDPDVKTYATTKKVKIPTIPEPVGSVGFLESAWWNYLEPYTVIFRKTIESIITGIKVNRLTTQEAADLIAKRKVQFESAFFQAFDKYRNLSKEKIKKQYWFGAEYRKLMDKFMELAPLEQRTFANDEVFWQSMWDQYVVGCKEYYKYYSSEAELAKLDEFLNYMEKQYAGDSRTVGFKTLVNNVTDEAPKWYDSYVLARKKLMDDLKEKPDVVTKMVAEVGAVFVGFKSNIMSLFASGFFTTPETYKLAISKELRFKKKDKILSAGGAVYAERMTRSNVFYQSMRAFFISNILVPVVLTAIQQLVDAIYQYISEGKALYSREGQSEDDFWVNTYWNSVVNNSVAELFNKFDTNGGKNIVEDLFNNELFQAYEANIGVKTISLIPGNDFTTLAKLVTALYTLMDQQDPGGNTVEDDIKIQADELEKDLDQLNDQKGRVKSYSGHGYVSVERFIDEIDNFFELKLTPEEYSKIGYLFKTQNGHLKITQFKKEYGLPTSVSSTLTFNDGTIFYFIKDCKECQTKGIYGDKTYEKKDFGDLGKLIIEKNKGKTKIKDLLPSTQNENKLKSKIKKLALNTSVDAIKNKLIKEMIEGKKFGDDNFKHWKDTFKFKKLDEKTGQLKDVKITSKMDEIMDRIDHFRKKYDEDDSFVRAVIDVFGTGIDVIQYTKGLAHLTEGIIPEGLLSVLSNLRESKELVTWTVKHYKDGNWELVKGNFNKQELLNVGKTKRERDERQKESENPAEGLKKKEEESMMILKRDEKEGLNGLPTKVKDKVKEKLRQGWTTETPFDFLSEFYTESEINSVFNEKIKIYKLKPSLEFFRSLAKNSAKINLKKGFCKSLKNAEIEHDISQREKNVLHNFISKCESKFGV